MVGGDHYLLVLVDTTKRTIEYYDARLNYADTYYKGKSGTIYLNEEVIKQYYKKDLPYTAHKTDIDAHFKKFAKELTKKYPGKPYTFVRKFNTYIATNHDDCGPWTLYCLAKRLKDPDTNFDTLNPKPNMKKYRVTIAYNIAKMNDYCISKGFKSCTSLKKVACEKENKEQKKKRLNQVNLEAFFF